MKRVLGFILVVVAIGMFSCGNKESEGMLKSVDSLYTAIKDIEVKILSMDTADYYKRIAYNEEKMKIIQDNFTDTATKEQAIFLSDITALRRSFTKLLRKREEVIDELLYSKGQILDLKKDVNNNLVLKNAFKEYYRIESQSITNLSSTLEGLISWGSSTVKRHENMKPKIEEFVSSLKE